ncbi:hypothetical protein HAX54_048117 [Datura stramonium]|uniref:Uncharacterized protein n=1 Tax=Datura stramonium TaxID=4076 RepID=A0ABS8STU3_DATST|nr:hypothetical protein [Datura stramonium]
MEKLRHVEISKAEFDLEGCLKNPLGGKFEDDQGVEFQMMRYYRIVLIFNNFISICLAQRFVSNWRVLPSFKYFAFPLSGRIDYQVWVSPPNDPQFISSEE